MKKLILICIILFIFNISKAQTHVYPSRENNLALLPGTFALTSSTHAGFSAESAFDGDRLGNTCGVVNNQAPCWGNNGGWNDNTYATFPDWFWLQLNKPYAISRIVLVNFQDEFNQLHEEPYLGLRVGGNYTNDDYIVEVCTNCNGSIAQINQNWIQVADVEENLDIINEFKFTPILGSAVRITINDAYADYSRIIELEVYAK